MGRRWPDEPEPGPPKEAQMKTVQLLSALLVLAAAGLCRPDPAASAESKTTGTPRERYEALVKEYEEARKDFSAAYDKARNDAERAKLHYPQPEEFSGRFLALAKEQPGGEIAAEALAWVASECRQGKDRDGSLELLLKDHLQSTNLEEVARSMRYHSRSEATERWLRAVWKDSPHHSIKGWAAYSLAAALNSGAGAAEAEKLLEDVAANYADVKGYRSTLADMAKGDLFELHHLAIGMTAPDIDGEDVEGRKFKLSDYRGKVVVIDFWGDW